MTSSRVNLSVLLMYQFAAMPVVATPRTEADSEAGGRVGTIVVTTVPGSADVYIDGKYCRPDVEGLVMEDVPAGSTDVKIRRDGYATWQDRVFVPPGGREEIHTTLERLEPSPGAFFVIALVFLGGVLVFVALDSIPD